MKRRSDKALVDGLRAGDRNAFKLAYERYKGDVLALITTMLGRQDGSLDLLHDVFVSFARNAPNLDPQTNLKGYLLTAGANRARDCLARRRTEPIDNETAAQITCCSTEDPANIAGRGEEAKRLWREVAALPDDQRVVVALRVQAGLEFKEISAREGIPEDTARSRYRYGIQKIRQKYMKE